jgi:hypothetical protein
MLKTGDLVTRSEFYLRLYGDLIAIVLSEKHLHNPGDIKLYTVLRGDKITQYPEFELAGLELERVE